MKLALFNGLSVHNEMFAYWLDYCQRNKIEADCYTTPDSLGYVAYYKEHFPSFPFYNPSEFSPSKGYSHTIVLTDDDTNFKDEWITPTTICIDHYYKVRRPQIPIHITTRKFSEPPPRDYALPAYEAITVEEKRRLLKRRVVCIGFRALESVETYKNLFPTFADLEFVLVNRDMMPMYEGEANMKAVGGMSMTEMMKLCRESEFIFIGDKNPDHVDKSMSGAVPLAFSCLCQLIMPKKMAEAYGFQSVITYEQKVELPRTSQLDAVAAERERIIAHRNEVFGRLLGRQRGGRRRSRRRRSRRCSRRRSRSRPGKKRVVRLYRNPVFDVLYRDSSPPRM